MLNMVWSCIKQTRTGRTKEKRNAQTTTKRKRRRKKTCLETIRNGLNMCNLIEEIALNGKEW